MSGQAYKVCPSCGQPAVLSMAVCRRCGFRYDGAGAPQITATRREVAKALGAGRRNWQTALTICGMLLVAFLGVVLVTGGGRSRRSAGQRSTGSNLVGAAISTDQIDQRLLRASAHMKGELDISLAWNSLSDLDIQVRDPAGELISAHNRRSGSGGEQDVDSNPTLLTIEGSVMAESGRPPGQGAMLPVPDIFMDMEDKLGLQGGLSAMEEQFRPGNRAPSRFTRSPVEHIYFNRAPRGTYAVFASCYSWREPNASPLAFTILVRSHGKVLVQRAGLIGPANWVADGAEPVQVCQFTVP